MESLQLYLKRIPPRMFSSSADFFSEILKVNFFIGQTSIICQFIVKEESSRGYDRWLSVILQSKPSKDIGSPPEVFLGKDVLEICSKFTGEHPCRSVMSMIWKWTLLRHIYRHGCSPVNLLHIFRALFLEDTFGGLLLILHIKQV